MSRSDDAGKNNLLCSKQEFLIPLQLFCMSRLEENGKLSEPKSLMMFVKLAFSKSESIYDVFEVPKLSRKYTEPQLFERYSGVERSIAVCPF